MNEAQPDIGTVLREARESAGLSAQEAAEKIQISVKRLQDYESGQVNPESATLLRLTGLYGIDMPNTIDQSALTEAEISELIGNLMQHDEVGRGDQFKALIKGIKQTLGDS